MPTVRLVDYEAKRIYLHVDTLGVPLDLLDVYRDVRALRAATPTHRQFRPLIEAGGNVRKTATTFTQPYVRLLNGAAIVPFPAAQQLRVIREVFSDDDRYGVDCFDRSTVSGLVDIDIDMQINPVEVREINVGGAVAGLKPEEYQLLLRLAKIHGLVEGVPSVVGPTSRVAGDVVQNISETAGVVTVELQ